MTDYNKHTVAQLRGILKDRGIPSTGLTRKAQIIEKLEEADREGNDAPKESGEKEAQEEAVQSDDDREVPETQEVEEAAPDDEPEKAGSPREPSAQQEASEPPVHTGDLPADASEPPVDTGDLPADASEPPPAEAIEPTPEADTTAAQSTAEASASAEPENEGKPEKQASPLPSPAREPSPAPRVVLEVVEPASEAVDFAVAAKTPSPAANERPSVEKADLLAVPDDSVETASVASINPEELEADKRKRKRRSSSPDMPLEDIKAKKARPSEEFAPDVHLKEDGDVVMAQVMPEADLAVNEGNVAMENETPEERVTEDRNDGNDVAMEDETPEGRFTEDRNDVAMEEATPKEEVVAEDMEEVTHEAPAVEAQKKDNESEFAAGDLDASDVKDLPVPEELPEESKPTAPEKSDRPDRGQEKGGRYKDIFQRVTPVRSNNMETDNRDIVPALHAATPALYIRNLMRPLKDDTLAAYLISLATPPSSDPDPDILKSFVLDSMKTHALVILGTTAAASRIRANLHGSVWPPERQRKELFVDFIPVDKAEDWIKIEKDYIEADKEGRRAGNHIPPKRYEVVYPESAEGTVEAVFQEVGSSAPLNAPRGPRSSVEHRRPGEDLDVRDGTAGVRTTTNPDVKRDLTKSFQTLDQLFDSTDAKPKLYYLPVSDTIADRRLDDLKDKTSPSWSPEDRIRGRGARARDDQKMRYSFDDEDFVVEVGTDFGKWADDSGGYRGGRGGYRGGGGYRGDMGGGFRSERGRGGGWGGGGYRGRGGWRG